MHTTVVFQAEKVDRRRNSIGMILFHLSYFTFSLTTAEAYSAKLVDGLGRPLSGVNALVVEEKYGVERVLQRTTSDPNGEINVRDHPRIPLDKIWIKAEKSGYTFDHLESTRTRLVLKKRFSLDDIMRLLLFSETKINEQEDRRAAVREILGGHFEYNHLFFVEDLIKSPLSELKEDLEVGELAKALIPDFYGENESRWVFPGFSDRKGASIEGIMKGLAAKVNGDHDGVFRLQSVGFNRSFSAAMIGIKSYRGDLNSVSWVIRLERRDGGWEIVYARLAAVS